jgi:hypothetical protein
MRRLMSSGIHTATFLLFLGASTVSCGGGGKESGASTAGGQGTGGSGGTSGEEGGGGTDGEGAGAGPGAGGSSTTGGGGTGSSVPSSCDRLGNEVKLTQSGAESFDLLWDNDHYVLAFADNTTGDLAVITLDAQGSVTGGPTQVAAAAGMARLPSLAKTGGGYAVAWEETAATPEVYVAALDGGGGPAGGAVQIAVTGGSEARPVLAPAAGGMAIAWMDSSGGVPVAQAALLGGDLALTGQSVRLGDGSSGTSHPWLAGDGTVLAGVWSDLRGGQFDIEFARLDNMTPTSEQSLRSAANDAMLGKIIRLPSGWFTAWEDARTGTNVVYFAITNDAGEKMSGGVAPEDGAHDANWPNLATSGASTAVVYYQFRDSGAQIYLTLIDGEGKRVAGGGDLQVSSSPKKARFPDVQWTGSEYGVAWVDYRDDVPQIWFSRVSCQ